MIMNISKVNANLVNEPKTEETLTRKSILSPRPLEAVNVERGHEPQVGRVQ